MKKQLLSLVLAGSMCMSLAPMAVFAEEAAAEPVTLDLFVDFTWFPQDSWQGIIPAELTKNGGVSFEVTRAADDGQLGLMIASGELPDLVWTDDVSKLCDPELVYAYDELIAEYGIDWEPDAERIGIAKTHNIDPEDDHYYTIVQNYNTQEEWANAKGVAPGVSGLYYRKDIWEALGSPSMDTLDDIFNVMGMVKEAYPDMMPLNAGNNAWRLSCFRDWFASSNDFLYVDDAGTVQLRDETEGFYNYLKFVNKMYKAGYFSVENLALTVEDDARQQEISGQTFMYEWNARPTPQMENLNRDLKKEFPDGQIALVPIPDDAVEQQRANSGWAGLFISKNCKDPEAAIKMVAYMNSEEGRHLALWGREGIDWIADENGAPQFTEEYLTARAGDTFTTDYANDWYMCTTELDEAYTYYSGLDEENLADFTKNLDKVVSYPELAVALPASGTDEAVIRSKINDARNAELVKIYTAETDEEFEAAYENWMSIIKQIGVEELDAYMTKRAAELKEQFGF